MINNLSGAIQTSGLPVPFLCDRRFGIGADGLIVIEKHDHLDFNMIYFNSDGSQSFCGNGSRCAVAFAKSLGIINNSTQFLSTDGEHYAEVDNKLVRLKMHDVNQIETRGNEYVLNTGSPHYIIFNPHLDKLNLISEARKVRYNNEFETGGINVNFIHPTSGYLSIRTYERGVEDETLSCGTGVTAAAIAQHLNSNGSFGQHHVAVKSRGGNLSVEFNHTENGFEDVFLIGPAKKTFKGSITLK